MEIRRAKNEDADGIMKLLYQVAEVHHKGRPDLFKAGCAKYTKEQLEAIIKDRNSPVFVAVEAEAVLGHAFCVLEETAKNGVLVPHTSLYIDDICVDKESRGRHVGTALCNRVLQYAKEEGCYNVTLNVWTLNENAIAFYKALGFKEQKIVMETVLNGD